MTRREYYFILVIRTNFRHVNACSELVQSIHILEYMRYKQLLINLYGKASRDQTFDNNMLILKYWCDEGDIFKFKKKLITMIFITSKNCICIYI